MNSQPASFVFLHGLIGDSSNWDLIVQALRARGYRCYAPEIPYFDDSTYRIEDFAENAVKEIPAGFIDADSIVVGNSLGCSLALFLSNIFSQVVLAAPYTRMYSYPIPRSEKDITELILSLAHDPSRVRDDEVSRHVARYRALKNSKRRLQHVMKLKKIKAATEAFDHDGLYRKWQEKIHLVYAGNDQVSPPAIFRQMKKDYPGMELHEVSECGHAIPVERPDSLTLVLESVAQRVSVRC